MYSDGAEDTLSSVLKETSDVSNGSSELLAHVTDFASRYHLSPERANLLWPVRKLLRGRVLEIGAGCGALSRFLGENGAEVFALEGNPARAVICRERCRDLRNVSVLAGSVTNVPVSCTFDNVLLVGVLEYSRIYFGGVEGPRKLLQKCRELLDPNGSLILAIENPLGLKYFAGAPEDHLWASYVGIHDQYADSTEITFGRDELERLLESCGFAGREFLYPFPDYRFPRAIIPAAQLRRYDANVASVLRMASAPDQFKAYSRAFSEEMAWPLILRNKLVEDLANSFLVVASSTLRTDLPVERVVSVFSSFRRKCFAKVTCLDPEQDGEVRRARLYLEPAAIGSTYEQRIGEEPLYRGQLLIEDFFEVVNRPGWIEEDVARCSQPWMKFLQPFTFPSEDRPHTDLLVSGDLMDCIPANLARDEEGALHRFDQEWISKDAVPLSFVVFRGLLDEFLRVQSIAKPGPLESTRMLDLIGRIMTLLGLPGGAGEVAALLDREVKFQDFVTGLGDRVCRNYEQLHLPAPRLIDALEEVNGLKHNLAELERRGAEYCREVEEKLASQAGQLEKAWSEVQELRTETQELRSEAQGLRAEAQELRAEAQELRSEGRELRSEGRELRSEGRELRSEAGRLRNDAEKLRGDLQVCENQSRTADQRAEALAGELLTTRQHAFNLEHHLNELQHSRAWRVGIQLARAWHAVSFWRHFE